MSKQKIIGHITTLFTILIWANTFISTKILLNELSPLEILFYRFVLGLFALTVISRKRIKGISLKDEIIFVMLGLTGVATYFFAENYALTLTTVSNVGLLVTLAPIMTAVLAHFTSKNTLKINTILGSIVALFGVFFVMYNGKFIPSINPKGDVLALAAAGIWAVYSILLNKANEKYPPLFVVKKSFIYGLIIIFITVLIAGEDFKPVHGLSISLIAHTLFLGLIASALCFVLWNNAVKNIGLVVTSNYIYLIPLLTMITSALVLHETINFIMILGGGLIIIGVYISQNNILSKLVPSKESFT